MLNIFRRQIKVVSAPEATKYNPTVKAVKTGASVITGGFVGDAVRRGIRPYLPGYEHSMFNHNAVSVAEADALKAQRFIDEADEAFDEAEFEQEDEPYE